MADAVTTVRAGSRGIGVLGWLFIIMFVLKLNPGGHLDSDVENWSWWAVTAPLWAPLALLLVGGVLLGIAWLGTLLYERLTRKRKAKKRLEARRARLNRNAKQTQRHTIL